MYRPTLFFWDSNSGAGWRSIQKQKIMVLFLLIIIIVAFFSDFFKKIGYLFLLSHVRWIIFWFWSVWPDIILMFIIFLIFFLFSYCFSTKQSTRKSLLVCLTTGIFWIQWNFCFCIIILHDWIWVVLGWCAKPCFHIWRKKTKVKSRLMYLWKKEFWKVPDLILVILPKLLPWLYYLSIWVIPR